MINPTYTKPKKLTERERSGRLNFIIDKIENLHCTLGQVAADVGVTRERVRQLYFKEKRHGVGELRHQETLKRRAIELAKKLQRDKEVKRGCSACGGNVYQGSPNRWLCDKCHDILCKYRKDPYTEFKCQQCGEKFRPHSNWKSTVKPQYCSLACYRDSGFFAGGGR